MCRQAKGGGVYIVFTYAALLLLVVIASALVFGVCAAVLLAREALRQVAKILPSIVERVKSAAQRPSAVSYAHPTPR